MELPPIMSASVPTCIQFRTFADCAILARALVLASVVVASLYPQHRDALCAFLPAMHLPLPMCVASIRVWNWITIAGNYGGCVWLG